MTDPRSELSLTPPGSPWGINYGGGTNSTALLLFCHDRGLTPDWILFADTGSELPETYANVERVREWCASVGFPFAVTRWLRKDGSFESIHANALRTNYLPSKAYGLAGCTWKWKIAPMNKWRQQNGFKGSTVAIGYDAGEGRRVERQLVACDDPDFIPGEQFWYPLVAWNLDRKACVSRLNQQGWPSNKSSCFMCPNMRRPEWELLEAEHPDLYQISLDIESNAKKAGNATSASLFRQFNPSQSCFCFADGCSIEPTD